MPENREGSAVLHSNREPTLQGKMGFPPRTQFPSFRPDSQSPGLVITVGAKPNRRGWAVRPEGDYSKLKLPLSGVL